MDERSIRLDCLKLVIEMNLDGDVESAIEAAAKLYDFVANDVRPAGEPERLKAA